jgi:hypothetical protein
VWRCRSSVSSPVGGSQSVLADFYARGDTFGCISVSYTYPAGG